MVQGDASLLSNLQRATGLEGFKVVQSAQWAAGPMCGRLLADWGMDVLFIEPPGKGDVKRGVRDSASRVQQVMKGRAIATDVDHSHQHLNRNKRSVTLDLSKESGLQVLHRLLDTADVYLHNFRQRELEKFGLEYETLSARNPGLVCAGLTGYGRRGPDRDLPAFEGSAFFARSGALHLMQSPSQPPMLHPLGMGDYMTGMSLAYGVMTALLMREKIGAGQEVDASLYQTGVFAVSSDVNTALITGQDRQSLDRRDVCNAVGNSYQTKDDRWLRLVMSQPDPYWPKLCRAIGREDLIDDRRFATFQPRLDNFRELFAILDDTFRSRPLAEWKLRLDREGLPWSTVQSLPEVCADPQARENDFFATLDHPEHGRLELVANPVRLGRTKPRAGLAPRFGQHTEEVLLEYGYFREDVARFRAEGVIA
jgi:crotonobetainyl-CoA:carnitine CoA-transferase CaiB-like acyl-CoA transferase